METGNQTEECEQAFAAAELGRAIEAARACPLGRVHVFGPNWEAVDLARAAVEVAGMSGRIVVHHAASAPLVLPPRTPGTRVA